MYTLYWYPKCGTCKKANAWLKNHQVNFETWDMIENPPKPEELSQWLTESGLPLRRFFNTSGQKYRQLGLKDQVATFTQEEACKLLSEDGMLIKRPLLVKDGHFVAIGFKEMDYEGAIN